MSLLPMRGRARRFGDDINTDYIIPSHRKKETIDPNVLSQYIFEDVDPSFANTVKPGDILVAGENFGCGSAMEVAVTVVLGAGIRAVVAKSFSRTYLRNALNNGLLVCVADTETIDEGADILIESGPDGLLLHGSRDRVPIACEPIPEFMLGILEGGGLIPYLRARGTLA
jgi:3-isopropylmalate/(R)-2-methylmalate dehydratase small subunit